MSANFKARRLGLLISSSNIVVEPVAMARCLEAGIQVHVARYRVLEGVRPEILPIGYDGELIAADVLSDAKVDVLCTTGTAAGWLGLETEEQLLSAISEQFGVDTYSLVHAVLDAIDELGARRLVFVTPYGVKIRERITEQFARRGLSVSHRHAEETDNLLRAAISDDTLRALCRSAAADRPDVIVLFCANFAGSQVRREMTEELGIPVLDCVEEFVSKTITRLARH